MPRRGYPDRRSFDWHFTDRPMRCIMFDGKARCPVTPRPGITLCVSHFLIEKQRAIKTLRAHREGYEKYREVLEKMMALGVPEINEAETAADIQAAEELSKDVTEPSDEIEGMMPVRYRGKVQYPNRRQTRVPLPTLYGHEYTVTGPPGSQPDDFDGYRKILDRLNKSKPSDSAGSEQEGQGKA